MSLNPAWDAFFALLWGGLAYWYLSSGSARAAISRIRQIAFIAALALGTVLTVGPVAHVAIHNFTIHMVQHIGLMMLISPLLIIGAPAQVAIARSPHRVPEILAGRVARTLLNPNVGFAIFLAVLVSTHFSPLADAGMKSANIHCLELILFIVGGTIYYYPVIEGNPTPHHVAYSTRVLSLFAMMLPETMVGFFLYSGNRLLHSLPDGMAMSKGINEQHAGGAIMWAMGMLIDTLWIVLAARDWFENERELSEAEDE